jgi:hypothetical protein
MKNAIAEGDRAVVRSLHSLCLAMDKPDEQPLTARESGSPFVASTLGFGLLAFTALVILIPLFLGL